MSAASPTRIRILLVDDHEVVRRGLRGFLELQDDMEVVGEASDGAIAIAQADSLEPDVVLMDLMMPNVDGLTAIAHDPPRASETDIVAVTSFIEEDKVTAALEAGASGYLLKDASAEEVAQAIRAAFAGEVHLDPQVARVLAQRMRARRDEPPAEAVDAARDRGSAAALPAVPPTRRSPPSCRSPSAPPRTHVSNILGKLGLASRTQAALWAVEHNMMGPRLANPAHMATGHARRPIRTTQLLQAAVSEAARLLESDGAMIYLYDEASGELRFAFDAGVTGAGARPDAA